MIRPLPVRRQPSRKRRSRPQPFDPAFVEYVYESRFVIASQVQRRFPHRLRSDRTTRWHMARLVDLGMIATTPVRSTGPNFPLVYHATGKGIRLVKETWAQYGREWEVSPAEERKAYGKALDSILHELLLTEAALGWIQAVNERKDMQLLLQERRYFRRARRLTFTDGGETHRIEPDFGFLPAMIDAGGKRTLLPLHFVGNRTPPPCLSGGGGGG